MYSLKNGLYHYKLVVITNRPPLHTRLTRHFQVNSPSRPASPNPAVRLVGLLLLVLFYFF